MGLYADVGLTNEIQLTNQNVTRDFPEVNPCHTMWLLNTNSYLVS